MTFKQKFSKKTVTFLLLFITENFYDMIKNSVFLDSIEQADIEPVYKKDASNKKGNCRSVSILPNLSKIYKCCMIHR